MDTVAEHHLYSYGRRGIRDVLGSATLNRLEVNQLYHESRTK